MRKIFSTFLVALLFGCGNSFLFNFTSESKGCHNIFVYKSSEDLKAFISVFADKEELALSVEKQEFLIQNYDKELVVAIDEYEEADGAGRYCNDAVLLGRSAKVARWEAFQGSVAISISKENTAFGESYEADVVLKDVVFENTETKEKIVLSGLKFKNVRVGWLAG